MSSLKAGSEAANSGGGILAKVGDWISNKASEIGQELKNVIPSGFGKTDAQLDAWQQGLKMAQASGDPKVVAQYIRENGTPGGWMKDVATAGVSVGAILGESAQKIAAQKSLAVFAAEKPFNESGLSVAARAWEKHAGREGGTFEPLAGNISQKNEAANIFIRDTVNNPQTIRTELSRGGFEYRAPSGQGVRFNSDGSFSGLLDPRK